MDLTSPFPQTGAGCRDILPVVDDLPAAERKIILHLDMDSFYASVETQRRQELAGKPVVIGADPKQGKGRGVVSTCSYEARKYGIRSAMPISRAYLLCPHATFLPPDFPAYVEASASVMEILRSSGFRTEQVSIDEAYLDITPLGDFEAATSFGEKIRAAIRSRLGLSCSVGIAPSRAVAKIASDYRKPDSLTVVPPASVREFLSPLAVRKIPGVGKKAENMLFEMGVRTIGDLAAQDVQRLIGKFGRGAIPLHHLACGTDGSGVTINQEMKSISRETTFETDTDNLSAIVATLDSLSRSVSENLTGAGLRFRTLTLKIRYSGFITRNRSRSLSHPSDDLSAILSLARTLFREEYDGRKIRLIGVRLSSFDRTDASQATLPS